MPLRLNVPLPGPVSYSTSGPRGPRTGAGWWVLGALVALGALPTMGWWIVPFLLVLIAIAVLAWWSAEGEQLVPLRQAQKHPQVPPPAPPLAAPLYREVPRVDRDGNCTACGLAAWTHIGTDGPMDPAAWHWQHGMPSRGPVRRS